MTNVEKVIKNLNTIVACCKLFTNKKTCSGIDEEMYADWANDIGEAVFLLKEQEPKKVMWRVGRANCPSCGELFPKQKENQYIRFCNYCGQVVKLDD